jgi:outer membrane protein W
MWGPGSNATFGWEKSGVLDSLAVKPSFGPAVQAGAAVRLSDRIGLDAGVRWNSQTTDIEGEGGPYASLKVHPIALGVGLGFWF